MASPRKRFRPRSGDCPTNRRLLESIGYVPPAEYEASDYAQLRAPDTMEEGVAAGILQPAPTDDRASWGIL